MPMSPVVANYNLALLPLVTGDPASVAGTTLDIERIMRNPFPIADDSGGHEFISARDQLGLAFRPALIVLTDHAGVMPVRKEMVAATRALIDFLSAQHVGVRAYGWNLDGSVSGGEGIAAVARLFNEPWVDEVMGLTADQGWHVPQIQIVAESNFSDRATLNLLPDADDGGVGVLQFSLNAHFDRQLALDTLAEEGAEFGRVASEVLTRLLAPSSLGE